MIYAIFDLFDAVESEFFRVIIFQKESWLSYL